MLNFIDVVMEVLFIRNGTCSIESTVHYVEVIK